MDTSTLPSRSKKKSFDELLVDPLTNSPSIENHEEDCEDSDFPIPARISCNVPIRIRKSLIPGAGRGTFVMRKVNAGSLIYSIDEPTLAVVFGEHIDYTCDNCFAIQGSDEKEILSNVSEPVKVSMCARCKSAAYCSKKCQTQAWKHHHKLECRILAAVKEHNENKHSHHTFRMILRLLIALENNLLSEEQVAAIHSLEGHVEAHLNPQPPTLELKELADTIYSGSFLAKQMVKTKMDPKEIRELICKIMNNSLALCTPVLHPPATVYSMAAGDQPGDTLGGYFDPFTALMNHDCTPNTFWTFEGKKLRVGACRDIEAGEELTLSYRPPATFVERQSRLKKSYKFTCTCETCRAGADRYHEIGFKFTPQMKVLRANAYDFHGRKAHDSRSLDIAKSFVRSMAEAGIPENFLPIPYLHILIVSLCFNSKRLGFKSIDTTTLLRSQLKIQYLNLDEKAGPERILIALQTNHLMQFILANKNLVPNIFTESYNMDELDPEILNAVKDIYWYDRVHIIWDIGRIHGVDSNLAAFEKKRLKEDLEQASVDLEDVANLNDPEKVQRAKVVLDKFAKEPLTPTASAVKNE